MDSFRDLNNSLNLIFPFFWQMARNMTYFFFEGQYRDHYLQFLKSFLSLFYTDSFWFTYLVNFEGQYRNHGCDNIFKIIYDAILIVYWKQQDRTEIR
jgi:hypothetical protein